MYIRVKGNIHKSHRSSLNNEKRYRSTRNYYDAVPCDNDKYHRGVRACKSVVCANEVFGKTKRQRSINFLGRFSGPRLPWCRVK